MPYQKCYATPLANSVLYQQQLLTADPVCGFWLVPATDSLNELAWARARYRASVAGRGKCGWCIEVFYCCLLFSTPPDEPTKGKQPEVGFFKFKYFSFLTDIPVPLDLIAK